MKAHPKSWQCISGCGACCYLEPEERPLLEEYLPEELLKLYYSLVGEDGWCIKYDAQNRTCSIYEDRPMFCRVSPTVLKELYDEPEDELAAWAIHCCTENIGSVWGEESPEMNKFKQANNLSK